MSHEVDNLRDARELFQMRSYLEDLDNEDWQIRVRAIGSLTHVKKTIEFYHEAVPKIIAATDDNNRLVRQASIPFLGDIGNGGLPVIKKLEECLSRDDESEIRSAVYSLGKIGPDSIGTIHLLISLLKKDILELNKAISWSLSMLGPDAVPDLINAIHSDNVQVKLGCISALGNMGPIAESSLGVMVDCLKETNADIRIEAAKAIGNLRAVASIGNCIEPLNVALTDQDPDVRWTSAEALRKIGTDDAMKAWASYQEVGSISSYLKQLTNLDKAVRLHAAEALYSVIEESPDLDFKILGKALHDSYPKVPVALCLAIGKIQDKAQELEDDLFELLSSGDQSVKAAAAQCLGKINAVQTRSTEKLIELLNDPEKEIRMSAGLALEFLDSKEARAALKRFKWE